MYRKRKTTDGSREKYGSDRGGTTARLEKKYGQPSSKTAGGDSIACRHVLLKGTEEKPGTEYGLGQVCRLS